MNPQDRAADGKFANKQETRVSKSFRCSPYLAEKLQKLPKTNDFIESAIIQAVTNSQLPPDPEWDYCNEWEALHRLILIVGKGIFILNQHDKKGEVADAELRAIKKRIQRWIEDFS